MALEETDEGTKALLVLYSGKKQLYCLYFGGEKEADSEKAGMSKDGYHERGRMWVVEKTRYEKVIE